MVTKVQIQNFKSLPNITLELGRVNILVGANSAGKTNILEGIALASAAAAGLLDDFALKSQLRLVPPAYMRSAFSQKQEQDILVQFEGEHPLDTYKFELHHDGKEYSRWRNRTLSSASIAYEYAENVPRGRRWKYFSPDMTPDVDTTHYSEMRRGIAEEPRLAYTGTPEKGPGHQERLERFGALVDYLIYAPDGASMKLVANPDQFDALGSRGEGLFRELFRIFSDDQFLDQQEEIRSHLALFDWFVDIKVQLGTRKTAPTILFRDRFMTGRLGHLDQNSIDDGFLHMLFYLVLFTSPDTPKFFAIENFESRFNPRMCWELMSLLAQLAKKHDKQCIVTTHNSSTLNGLDLKDDQQRLFVTSRNAKGHTRVQRISQKPDNGTMLSEIWTKGYIGGMPDNL